MAELKTIDEFGFLFSFIGGIIIVVNAIAGLIMGILSVTADFFINGIGFFPFIDETWGLYVGAAINIVIGIVCILMGLKIFTKSAYKFMIQFDLVITAIVMIILGVISFGIGGLLVIIGGIFILVYRLSSPGNRNPRGK
jgi:hypothetical protein